MTRVVILYIESGGGHRAAALALEEMIRQQGRPWNISLVNAEEVLEPADPAFWLFRHRWCEVYNWLLRRGWTYGSGFFLWFGHAVYRLLGPAQEMLLRRRWRALRPDLVVSVTPHLGRPVLRSLKKEAPGAPLVTVLTDLADYPPLFWIERQEQHFVCGTAKAVEQARAIAGDAATVWPVSGMVLHPKFYAAANHDRARERQGLGLDPVQPTGLVLYGGQGADAMLNIARAAARAKSPVQMIFLCGRNRRLAERLRALKLPYRSFVQEFTDDVPHFMRLSDFFIGKPGPGSISEALAMGLPVILKQDASTMVHERYNIDWVLEQKVGMVIRRFQELPVAIEALLEDSNFAEMARRVRALRNRAVFEIPEVLSSVLTDRQSSSSAALSSDCGTGAGNSPAPPKSR